MGERINFLKIVTIPDIVFDVKKKNFSKIKIKYLLKIRKYKRVPKNAPTNIYHRRCVSEKILAE